MIGHTVPGTYLPISPAKNHVHVLVTDAAPGALIAREVRRRAHQPDATTSIAAAASSAVATNHHGDADVRAWRAAGQSPASRCATNHPQTRAATRPAPVA